MCKTDKVKEKIKKQVRIKAKDKEGLLYNFLEELLFLLDSENFALSKIKNIEISAKNDKCELKAEVFGDNATQYKFFGDVKAATYNEMFIKQDKKTKRFIIQAVVDM
jgi:SHS2 domain-containing protein